MLTIDLETRQKYADISLLFRMRMKNNELNVEPMDNWLRVTYVYLNSVIFLR